MNKRTIAVISKSDETGGGASRIAAGLVRLLNTLPGYEAHHWMGLPGMNPGPHTRKLHGGRWLSLVQGACAVTSRALGFPDFLTPELAILWTRKQLDYDLYHFHDISFTFSPLALNWLARRRPVIWTMHDCSPFTGGCIYPLQCTAFQSRCGNCPQLSVMPLGTSRDFTGWMQTYKLRVLSQGRVTLVSPSRWLVAEARKARGLKVPIRVVPNFVDHGVFRSIDKTLVRHVLGLPPDRFMVLLSATSLADERKGFNFALAALQRLRSRPYVLAVGQPSLALETALRGFDLHISGYVYNDRLLAQYYAAADVLLFTSLADNLPTVILETMACGTPAVAFRTGGVPEMISHDVHGWLARPGEVPELVAGLDIAASEPVRMARWRDACLTRSVAEYHASRFLEAQVLLCEQAITADRGG